jgi:sterol desaturase/sphingolipid hydroxylase (fatty acid hydroxylase superfamily)
LIGAILGLSFSEVLLTLVFSVVVAELAGYGLHRLMHSCRISALSRAHLIHHLTHYGPQHPMRTAGYKDATHDRAAIGNVGLEWLVPSAIILGVCLTLMWFLRVPLAYRLFSMFGLLGWPIFMFSYLHDRMHIQGFWMERAPLLKWWFRKARRLHDIHHHSIDEHGRMDRNFGIGFFVFDRIFQTFARRHCPLNWRGYRAAVKRAKLEEELEEEYSRFPSGFHV